MQLIENPVACPAVIVMSPATTASAFSTLVASDAPHALLKRIVICQPQNGTITR